MLCLRPIFDVMVMKKVVFGLLLAVFVLPLRAEEGMWLPFLLKQLNEARMKELGLKLSAQDIYDVNHSSLKDAIVQFDGGCTSELISAKGLLLTNHHCGYSQIQFHSRVDNDLLTDGFWAKSLKEELKNPGVTATFVRYMEDVTAWVTQNVNANMTSVGVDSLYAYNAQKLIESKGGKFEYEIVPIFYGNQFILIASEVFKDVRLVGAPPSSIGKFGADTDNWVWPRHTGDFSLFRIYANANNEPADVSDNNRPYTSEGYLKINTSGVKPGDFTMVFGFPGTTQQYLPAEAVRLIVETEDPLRVAVRTIRLEVMDVYMRRDDATRIKYAAQYARIANGWKKWIGEMQGVEKTDGLGRKMAFEAEFNDRLRQNRPLQAKYGSLLDELNAACAEKRPLLEERTLFVEVFYAGSQTLNRMMQLERQMNQLQKKMDDEGVRKLRELLSNSPDPLTKTIEHETITRTFALFAEKLPAERRFAEYNLWAQKAKGDWSAYLFAQMEKSSMWNAGALKKALKVLDKKGVEALRAHLEKSDPFYGLELAAMKWLRSDIEPKYQEVEARFNALMKQYMKAQIDLFPEKTFYPDANSTLRLSFGKVEGFSPQDGAVYNTHTYLDGVKQKYVPGDYEFDVHPKLLELLEKGDFGAYGENGRMPVCFIASNHTTGGNSGSPALDAQGRLIGLNFDRLWEGTMSDINYDAGICRNIMVDVRYILFVIDKFAGAGHLIEEMELLP